MLPMFRTTTLVADMPCKGGHEMMLKGSQVICVEGMDELLRSEVGSHPYCGYDHVRTYAQQRGLDFEGNLKTSGATVTQLEHLRKVRRAWSDLEKAAEKAEFGRTRGTR
jgi:hypothetical protein